MSMPSVLADAVREAIARAGLPAPPRGAAVEPSRRREHGDFQTSVAFELARTAGSNPRDVAARIAAALESAPPPHLARVEVAGAGFLNLFLEPSWLHDVLREVVRAGDSFGTGTALAGHHVNLEFVSANPTGPLHAGAGRWVAVGDAIANLLAAQGARVHREYYLNDAGTQLDAFGASLYARYRGEDPPSDGYRGEYLLEMAARLRAERGDDVNETDAREWGYHDVVRQLREDLERIGVRFDTWFSERTLHERGEVDDTLRVLEEGGWTYESDGARWLRTESLGDQRDRVLVTRDGRRTYLATDLAYHREKMRRGFDHLVDIWGADHHGQVKSLQAGMQMLGLGSSEEPEPEIILGQLVKLERGGKLVRLSKRSGDVITLADILDEVDPDVARLTFLLQGIDTPQTFDLDLVTAQSMANPVYYVQYAHARIMSIDLRASERGVRRGPLAEVDLSLLTHERETDLLRALADLPEVVAVAAELRAPHRVTTWARDFAGRFHGFYRDCRVLTDDVALTQARLWLAEACRVGLAAALGILGVGIPEHMARLDEAVDRGAGDVEPGGLAGGGGSARRGR